MKYQRSIAILAFVVLGPLSGFVITTVFYLFLVPDAGYFLERMLNESGVILMFCYGVGILPALGTGITFVCQRDEASQMLSTLIMGVTTSCLVSLLLAPWLMWMMRLPPIILIPLFMVTGGGSGLVIALILNLLMGKPIRRRQGQVSS